MCTVFYECVLYLRVQRAKAWSERINQLTQENKQLVADMREVKGNQKVHACVYVCACVRMCIIVVRVLCPLVCQWRVVQYVPDCLMCCALQNRMCSSNSLPIWPVVLMCGCTRVCRSCSGIVIVCLPLLDAPAPCCRSCLKWWPVKVQHYQLQLHPLAVQRWAAGAHIHNGM